MENCEESLLEDNSLVVDVEGGGEALGEIRYLCCSPLAAVTHAGIDKKSEILSDPNFVSVVRVVP